MRISKSVVYALVVFFMVNLVVFFMVSSVAHAQGLTQFGMWEESAQRAKSPEWTTQVYREKQRPVSKKKVNTFVPPQLVEFESDDEVGTIVIVTSSRRLYLIKGNNTALEYVIAVGREGFAWTGEQKISRIVSWPTWTPPPAMRKRMPHLPEFMDGGPNNPLGAIAVYLGDTQYRIHGTNDPKSIGKAESSGCFRMHNENALNLAAQVKIGTLVRVIE